MWRPGDYPRNITTDCCPGLSTIHGTTCCVPNGAQSPTLNGCCTNRGTRDASTGIYTCHCVEAGDYPPRFDPVYCCSATLKGDDSAQCA